MGTGAFATEPTEPTEPTEEGAELYDLENAVMTKDLHVADGIDISEFDEFTFTFEFDADDSVGYKSGDTVPTIEDQTISVGEQSSDHAYGELAMSDVFTDANAFPHAGVFAYQVNETAIDVENLTCDESEYIVRIYVANDGDNLKFDGITVEKDGEKVDPEKEGDTSGFNFENVYDEPIISEDGVLTVTKTIGGDYGDKTKEFSITVTVTIPSTAEATDVEVEDGTVEGEAPTLTVTKDLANDGTIKFTKLPAGTTFKVEETQDAEYTGKIEGDLITTASFDKGANIEAESTGPILIAGNEVTLTNNRDEMIPTGVIINTLPYILIVAIAAAGFFYIQMKKKA
jgi:hypothetical protein